MLVVVMAFSLSWHTLVHDGHGGLMSPHDLWSLAGSSSMILHGRFGDIYVRHGALTSPPALEVALVPVTALGELLGLSPRLPGTGEPLSMWLVLGPAAVLMASTVLFALDAVARQWRFSEQSRLVLALVGAFGVANVVGWWGHPEDCVSVAFAVWAALAVDRFGTAGARRAGWLLGFGVAFQPLALLAVVPVLARLNWRDAGRQVWRIALPSLLFLLPPLLAETHRTLFVMVRQPFEPAYISLTPLTPLATHLAPGLDGGGFTRLAAIVVSAAVALVVCRRYPGLDVVLASSAFAFFVRILLETEMNWYYVWPVPALCLLLALRRSRFRFTVCAAALASSVLLGDRRVHGIALWWPALMATAVVMLLSAAPPPRRWPRIVRGLGRVRGSVGGQVGGQVGSPPVRPDQRATAP
jgi:hypothetical protein